MHIYYSLQKQLCSWRNWSEVSRFIFSFRGQFLQLSLLPISRDLAGDPTLPDPSCISLPALAFKLEDSVVMFSSFVLNSFLQYRTLSILLQFFTSFPPFLKWEWSAELFKNATWFHYLKATTWDKKRKEVLFVRDHSKPLVFFWLQWSVLVLCMIHSRNKTCSLSFSWWWMLGNKPFPPEPVLARGRDIVSVCCATAQLKPCVVCSILVTLHACIHPSIN